MEEERRRALPLAPLIPLMEAERRSAFPPVEGEASEAAAAAAWSVMEEEEAEDKRGGCVLRRRHFFNWWRRAGRGR